MYRYRPDRIIELDEVVRASIRAQQRMEQVSLALLRDAQARIARAQRPLIAVSTKDSAADGPDAPVTVQQ